MRAASLRWLVLIVVAGISPARAAQPLPGTEPLRGLPNVADIVKVQQAQVLGWFLQRIGQAEQARAAAWQPDFRSREAYEQSLAAERARCREMLGVTDLAPSPADAQRELLAESRDVRIERVTVPSSEGLSARGLLFSPRTPGRHPLLIVCPDAETWPEAWAGLSGEARPPLWLTDTVARNALVFIPQSIERLADHPYCRKVKNMDRRKVLYRLGYVTGRSMPGIDVQETILAVGYLGERPEVDSGRIGLAGIGQGGMTALYTAALDRRIAATAVAGYFQCRDRCWEEPADRRLPAQLVHFGDAEVAAMIAPRMLAIAEGPSRSPAPEAVTSEFRRAASCWERLHASAELRLQTEPSDEEPVGRPIRMIADGLGLSEPAANRIWPDLRVPETAVQAHRDRHFEERLAWLRKRIDGSEAVREKHWGLIDRPAAEFPQIQAGMLAEYRQLVGHVPTADTPLRPRTELALITDKYKAYRVLLDVTTGVELYGHLLVPRESRRRAAAVICQHGLNGTPDDITGLGRPKDTVYHEFGRRLAEHGYVVFAPLITHHYLPYSEPNYAKPVNDKVRAADAVGMMRLAMVVAKTNRAIDFLQSLPFVDGDHIGYYGLSYGGYSAAWSGPLVERLAAVVVSGNFNDQRAKLTSDEASTSYLLHPYEDAYNWNSLHRFTYPELIAMTAPRAVCIEFGQRDTITTPEWTARAWKQVEAIRDRLGLGDRIEMVEFQGDHEIHGSGVFDFLDRFLRPERSVGRDYEYDLMAPFTTDWFVSLKEHLPFVEHVLDAREESWFGGRFWMPSGAKQFRGMAVKVSREGCPGPLEVRFGSEPGKDDLGTAGLSCDTVLPLWDVWHSLRVPAISVQENQSIYFQIRCRSGTAPKDHYVVYGPRPLGGRDLPDRFALAYQVLTDRPQDGLCSPGNQPMFEHVRSMLGPSDEDDPSQRLDGRPARPGETAIDGKWIIHHGTDDDGVLANAAGDLKRFLAARGGIDVAVVPESAQNRPQTIDLLVTDDAQVLQALQTSEGYRVVVEPQRVAVLGRTPRGVMRGVYWLEDAMRLRGSPVLRQGQTDRNCRFDRRITCTISISGLKYTEVSHPLPYTDGILQRISHQGFNGIWLWVNAEEITHNSTVFPELNHPEAELCLARIRDVVERAKPLGIDVYLYYATWHHHPVPASFYQKHPDCRGVGHGGALCTSHPDVRRYYDETTRHLFRTIPGLGGLIVIFDCEGFHYCGYNKQGCPRCRQRKSEDIAAELIGLLDGAMRAEQPGARLMAWSYRPGLDWVYRTIPQLPKEVLFLSNFSRGALIQRDGKSTPAGDYTISVVGPPEGFVRQYEASRAAGLGVVAKTEHAIAQEFIAVPYIPCLPQWHARCQKLGEFALEGFLANWCHYGYTPSRPAEILMWYSWSPAPPLGQLLEDIAQRDFGPGTGPLARSAWAHFTKGIQYYPTSNPVTKVPGPIQKGPSQPLFLDPKVKNFGSWRSWQNDLNWTQPWGPELTEKCFLQLKTEFDAGIDELRKARAIADPRCHAALDAEIGVAETISRSVHTILNLMQWVPLRDAYAAAEPGPKREQLRKQLLGVARNELDNARAALILCESDSRLGCASSGDGMPRRGGLFTPPLIRRKIGMLEDAIERQLAD